MRPWAVYVFVINVLLVWTVYVAVTLFRHEDIPAPVWGLPGLVWLAVKPVLPKDKKER
jgi:hypothetical protein